MPRQHPGNTLLMVLVFVVAISALAVGGLSLTQTAIRGSRTRVLGQQAVRIAESGIEKAVWCLNNPSSGCPGGSSFIGETSVTVGDGTYTSTWDSGTKTITATSTVDAPGGPLTRTAQAVLARNGADLAFQYGLQVGTGGIVMSNSAQIVGNVFSNGSITGTNSANITGDVILAVGDATTNVSLDPSPNTTSSFGQTSPATRYVTQSFVPTMTDSIYEIDVKVARTAVAPAAMNAKIYTHDSVNNRPASQLATKSVAGSTFPVNSSGWENGWTEISIGPVNVTAGTKYWIVLEVSTTNNSNYYTVLHSTDDQYAGNLAKIGGDLTTGLAQLGATDADFAFAVKMGGTFPTLSLTGGVGGSVKAHTIDNTTVGSHAYYQGLNGTVRANGGSESCSISTAGTFCHPITSEETPADFPLTSAQVNQLELDAGTTQIGTQNISSGTATLGPVVINGDLNISNTAIVTLAGTIWVKGNINLSNSAQLVLSNSYTSDSGIIIAHDPANPTTKGKIFVSNSAQILGNSTPDTFILAIAMSNDLSSSTVNMANSQAGSIFYAPNGLVSVSNSASLKELIAKKITMANTAVITYDSGLQNEFFSSGPGGSWTYKKGSYQVLQ